MRETEIQMHPRGHVLGEGPREHLYSTERGALWAGLGQPSASGEVEGAEVRRRRGACTREWESEASDMHRHLGTWVEAVCWEGDCHSAVLRGWTRALQGGPSGMD